MKYLIALLLILPSCTVDVVTKTGNGYTFTQYTNKKTQTRKVVLQETQPNGFNNINQYIKGYNE